MEKNLLPFDGLSTSFFIQLMGSVQKYNICCFDPLYIFYYTIQFSPYNIIFMKIIILLPLFFLLCSSYSPLCSSCLYPLEGLRSVLQFIAPTYVAAEALQIICMRKYNSKPLCEKVGKELAPIGIQNFFDNYFNPKKICSGVCGHPFVPYSSHEESERILSQGEVPKENLQEFVEREFCELPQQKSTYNILHLTDIHLDLNYKEKSSVNCDYPICCHEENGFPENPTAQAKPYGSINCDTPPKLLSETLDYIKGLKTDVDLVVTTGDFSAHDEWKKTEATIQMNERYIKQIVREKLGDKLIILTTSGNNDYTPDHQTSPEELNYLVKVTKVKAGSQNLTFISLNNIVTDNLNLYLFGDQTYAIYQLKILQQELAKNQNIYIFGHIPPNHPQCANDYSAVYRSLITRYHYKIRGQFYGHTHQDQLFINTSPQNQKTVSFGFISGSISPFFIGQSRFRIYSISDHGVYDYEQHHFNNLNSMVADWKKEYSFKQRYNITDTDNPITNEEIDKIVKKLFEDEEARRLYLTLPTTEDVGFVPRICQILDDGDEIAKCKQGKKDDRITESLFDLIEKLRRKWSFQKNLTIEYGA